MNQHHTQTPQQSNECISDLDDHRAKRRRTSSVNRIDRETGLMRDGDGNGLAGFVGSASGIHFVRSVYGSIARRSSSHRREQEAETPAISVVPGEEDSLQFDPASSTQRPLWHAGEVAPVDRETAPQTTSFKELVDWSQSYFDNWHPAFPFLHGPSVLGYFEGIAAGTIGKCSPEKIIVRSILSMSLADRRQTGIRHQRAIPSNLVFPSFADALDGVQMTLSAPVSILSLQAALCVQLFLVSMLRHNAASRLGGLIVRMAFQLGLHRCPTRYKAFSLHEAQLRRRIFWSVYCVDRHVCQSLGLPLGIRDDDVDVCYPGQETHVQPSRRENLEVSDDRLKLLTFLAKQAKIKGLIVELRNKNISYVQQNIDQAILISTELNKWWNEVEDFIELTRQQNPQQTYLSPYHEITLVISRHESKISLNRPTLASSKNTAAYGAAVQICIGASMAIIRTLESFMNRETSLQVPERAGGTQSSALVWPSLTWAVWMSAFILIYAAAEGHISTESALRGTERSLTILEHLSLRDTVWPVACAVAIRDLRSTLTQMRANEGTENRGTVPITEGTQPDMQHQHQNQSMQADEQGSDDIDVALGLPRHKAVGGPRCFESDHPDAYSSNASWAGPTSGSDQQPSFRSHEKSVTGSGTVGLSRADAINMQSSLFALARPADEFNHPMMPEFSVEGIDAFAGFDIPFWMGQDQYTDLMGDLHEGEQFAAD